MGRSLAYSLTRQRPIRDLTCTLVYNIHRHSHREYDTWRILPSQVDSILNVSLYWTTFLLTNLSLVLTKLNFIKMGRIPIIWSTITINVIVRCRYKRMFIRLCIHTLIWSKFIPFFLEKYKDCYLKKNRFKFELFFYYQIIIVE